MTEDLSEEKRVWYLKGYEQAERDYKGFAERDYKGLIELLTAAYGVIDSDYDGTEEHLVLRREIEAVLDKGDE